MSGRDAFENEMGFPGRISPKEAEHLLSNPGRDGVMPELADVAAFARALPAAVAVQPDPGLEAAVVARAADAARAATLEAAHSPTVRMTTLRSAGPWRRQAAVVAAAIALVPAFMVGLALAGVTLPEPAREAFERVGIELPNQSAVDDGNPAGTEPAGKEADGDGAKESRSHEARGAQSDGGDGEASDQQGEKSDHEGGAPGSQGRAGHGANGEPQGRGPESTPPGHGATPPGQGGVPPGQGAAPPGEEVVPPSEGGEPPGQAGTAPGQGEAPPGRGP
jgi:hypothetical protein